ncbi:hypothetical protein Ancab_011882 [Ancistrocladus abbreviatus]
MAATSTLAVTSRRLEGKVALITGGASGIGAHTARFFAKHGAKVVIVDILDELGQSVCSDIGPNIALYIHCDVTKESDVENAVNMVVAKFGKLDVMINNAAIIDEAKQSILENDVAEFERVLRVNLTGVFLGTKHAARVMIPAHQGNIIAVGSVSTCLGGIATHAYTSSKHGMTGLTKNAAVELGRYGIRVNCVSPYFIQTPLGKEFFKMEDQEANSIYSNLNDRHLELQDVADALLYLAGDESKYVSGHNLLVDGGFTITNPAFGLFARSNI